MLFHRYGRLVLMSLALLEVPHYGWAWSYGLGNDLYHRLHRPPQPQLDAAATEQTKHSDALSTRPTSPLTRRQVMTSTTTAASFLGLFTGVAFPSSEQAAHAAAAGRSCADIESCREIGERKDAANLADSPIMRIPGYQGLQYKVLNPGLGEETVSESNKMVKMMYSIAQASGRYMYSRGMGFNKIKASNGLDLSGQTYSDFGIDGLIVDMTNMDKDDSSSRALPIGIQQAMLGMKRGERRRIQCPVAYGFETSDWNPQPTDFRGRQQIKDYQALIYGRGDAQPAFAAPTIWDVEVISIR